MSWQMHINDLRSLPLPLSRALREQSTHFKRQQDIQLLHLPLDRSQGQSHFFNHDLLTNSDDLTSTEAKPTHFFLHADADWNIKTNEYWSGPQNTTRSYGYPSSSKARKPQVTLNFMNKGKQMDIHAVMDEVCTDTGIKLTAVNRTSSAFQSIRPVF